MEENLLPDIKWQVLFLCEAIDYPEVAETWDGIGGGGFTCLPSSVFFKVVTGKSSSQK